MILPIQEALFRGCKQDFKFFVLCKEKAIFVLEIFLFHCGAISWLISSLLRKRTLFRGSLKVTLFGRTLITAAVCFIFGNLLNTIYFGSFHQNNSFSYSFFTIFIIDKPIFIEDEISEFAFVTFSFDFLKFSLDEN